LIQVVRTSLGGIGQMTVAMTAWIFLMRILASISTEAVAGATITLRIVLFTLMPAWGMSDAAATLVGQNLGAGEPGRAEATVWRIGWMSMAFTLVVSVTFFFLHDELIAVFSDDKAVIAIGGKWLSILSYSYFVYGWWMVSVQAFNGAGDTVTPTWINLVFFWLMQLPLAWALALPLGWAQSGVFWACSSRRRRSVCSRCRCSAEAVGSRRRSEAGTTWRGFARPLAQSVSPETSPLGRDGSTASLDPELMPTRPTIGSFTPFGLMPKFKPSTLNSSPSTALTARPSTPPNDSWNPLPLGAVPIMELPR